MHRSQANEGKQRAARVESASKGRRCGFFPCRIDHPGPVAPCRERPSGAKSGYRATHGARKLDSILPDVRGRASGGPKARRQASLGQARDERRPRIRKKNRPKAPIGAEQPARGYPAGYLGPDLFFNAYAVLSV